MNATLIIADTAKIQNIFKMPIPLHELREMSVKAPSLIIHHLLSGNQVNILLNKACEVYLTNQYDMVNKISFMASISCYSMP